MPDKPLHGGTIRRFPINRLFGLVFLATLFALATSGIVLYQTGFSRHIEREAIHQGQLRHAGLAAQLDSIVLDQEKRIVDFARSRGLISAIEAADHEAVINELEDFTTRFGRPVSYLTITVDGRPWVNVGFLLDGRAELERAIDFTAAAPSQLLSVTINGVSSPFLIVAEPISDGTTLFAAYRLGSDPALFAALGLDEGESVGLLGLANDSYTPLWGDPQPSAVVDAHSARRSTASSVELRLGYAVSSNLIPWTPANDKYALLASTSVGPYLDLRDRVVVMSLIALLVACAIAALGFVVTRRLLGRSAKQLVEYTERASIASDTPLPPDVRVEEFDHVTAAIQDMVGTIDEIQKTKREAEAAIGQLARMQGLSQLLRGVAHDFNNTLAVIIGTFELLRVGNPSGERLQTLVAAGSTAAATGQAITKQLLASAGQSAISFRSVELRELLETSARSFATVVPKTRLIVDPGVLSWAWVDADLLAGTLLNLVINSSRAGATEVHLAAGTAHYTGADNQMAEIRIRDNGPGIDPAIVANIFDPFFTTDEEGGNGLGLAMAKAFMDQSEGSIEYNSPHGGGAEFLLLLPKAQPDLDVVDGEVPSLHVAVVDDETDARRVLGEMLVHLGSRVTDFEDVAAMRGALARGAEFDLVITDFHMPGESGLDLVKHLQTERPTMPILALSADTDLLASIGQEQGSLRSLRKPANLESLGAVLAWAAAAAGRVG